MANFQTHLTASTLLGIGYGGVAYGAYAVPLPSCILAAGLCSVSGMLPDIDSGPGRPLREITTFMAAVVPTMLFGRLLGLGLSHESIILIGAAIYVAIRFGFTVRCRQQNRNVLDLLTACYRARLDGSAAPSLLPAEAELAAA